MPSLPPDESNLEEGIIKHTVLSMPVPRSSEFGPVIMLLNFVFEGLPLSGNFDVNFGSVPFGHGF